MAINDEDGYNPVLVLNEDGTGTLQFDYPYIGTEYFKFSWTNDFSNVIDSKSLKYLDEYGDEQSTNFYELKDSTFADGVLTITICDTTDSTNFTFTFQKA